MSFGRVALLASLAALWAWPAGAPVVAPGANPASVPAVEGRCIRLVKAGGQEILVNTCQSCQQVKVMRSRASSEVPTNRDITVMGNAKSTLPFKGPGSTRVMSEEPCESSPGSSPNLVDPLKQPIVDPQVGKCVRPQRSDNGVLALVNQCGDCRSVLMEEHGARNQTSHRAYSVGGRSAIKLPTEGVTAGRIVKETACTK